MEQDVLEELEGSSVRRRECLHGSEGGERTLSWLTFGAAVAVWMSQSCFIWTSHHHSIQRFAGPGGRRSGGWWRQSQEPGGESRYLNGWDDFVLLGGEEEGREGDRSDQLARLPLAPEHGLRQRQRC